MQSKEPGAVAGSLPAHLVLQWSLVRRSTAGRLGATGLRPCMETACTSYASVDLLLPLVAGILVKAERGGDGCNPVSALRIDRAMQ